MEKSSSDVFVEKEQEYRFNFGGSFYVAYNVTQDFWYARHEDEDMYEEDVILEDESNNIVFGEQEIVLFDDFVLSKEDFDDCKKVLRTFL